MFYDDSVSQLRRFQRTVVENSHTWKNKDPCKTSARADDDACLVDQDTRWLENANKD